MIRQPLIPSDEPAYTPHSIPPEAWIAVGFAGLFLISALYQGFVLINTKACFTSTFVAASSIQCISLVANAYDLAFPASTGWYVVEGLTCPLAPILVMIACIQTFGRAAWASVIPNRARLARFRGFLRWNTSVFINCMLLAYILMVIGNLIVVATTPGARADHDDHERLKAAYGVVEAGLVVQTLVLAVFMVLPWRWRVVGRDWDVDYDGLRQYKWNWKTLLRNILICCVLLLLKQAYLLLRFFLMIDGLVWLHFICDAVPMLISVIILTVWHPGTCLPHKLTAARLNQTLTGSGDETSPDTEKYGVTRGLTDLSSNTSNSE